MEIFLIKKFKNAFAITMIITALSAVLIVALLALGVLNAKARADMEDQEKQLDVYRKTVKTAPEKAVAYEKSLESRLNGQKQQLSAIFDIKDPQISDAASPLAFKQFLFNVQSRLEQRAKKDNMELVPWFGFEEFKLKVPAENLTETLVKELIVVEKIIDRALDSGINSVDSIKLSHQNLNLTAADQKFSYLPISLSVTSGSAQIKSFLMGITEMDQMVIIKQLKMQKLQDKDNLLSTQINLNLIEI